MTSIRQLVPPDWSGDQARAVVELLDDIASAVWDAHEDKILASFDREETRLVTAAEDDAGRPEDDGLPF